MQQLVQSQATAALRRIPVYLVDAVDGVTPETGITFAAGDIKLSKNGAAETNHTGTVTELVGSGLYYYEATAAELNTLGFLSARFSKAGVRTFVAVVQVGTVSSADPAAIADAVWDESAAAHAAPGSTGAALLAAGSAGDPWITPLPGSYAPGTAGYILAAVKTTTDDQAFQFTQLNTKIDAVPTAGENADAVWDEQLSPGHMTAGSAGARLVTAGNVTDPWNTSLPGAYPAGSAGNILGVRLDVVSSTLATAAVQTAQNAYIIQIPAIKSQTDKIPNNPATVGDVPSASAISTAVWAAGTRELTSFGTLISQIWAAVVDSTGVTTLLTRLTPTRAANLDGLTPARTANLDNADIATSTRATPAQVLTQVNAALDAPSTELIGVPTATGSLRRLIQFLHAYFRNQKVTTMSAPGVGTETLMKEDLSDLGTAAIGDDGTIFTKGQMG